MPKSARDVQSIDIKSTVGIAESVGGPFNNINGTVSSLYYIHSCFLYNDSRTETTFDKNGQNPITTTLSKYYDNVAHLQPTRIEKTESDGSVLTTVTTYPDDYAPGEPFIDHMRSNHLSSFPIEQIVYKQKGGVNNIVTGNLITYKNEGSGLPDKLFKLETASPIPQSSFKISSCPMGALPPASQSSVYNADTHYQPVVTYTLYDNKGNLLESLSRNGIKTSYLWGYNQEYPVAQIVGADYTTVSGKIGNLSILNNPSSDESLRIGLNSLRTISGAFATTYTFAPLIGVTSETDPNGRTTYYEYDPFKRLWVVRDQNRNILKKICYTYVGQAEACGFYQSNAINADYYSQNCSSDQTPVAYHISVPQGMFTSSVDQLTANQLAQQYAQSQANQYGTCQILNVSVYGENNSGASFTIQIHNINSGQNYSFTTSPHSADPLGEVPLGSYNITIIPPSGISYYSCSVGCGYYSDGSGVITISGVDINSSCNSITID